MFLNFDLLIKHMIEEHPDSNHFGDSAMSDENGKVIFQKCQLCGKILVGEKEDMVVNNAALTGGEEA